METLTFYIGRDNEEIIELLQNGEVVTADAVTRAVFRFGDYCLDTENVDDEIRLFNDNQRVGIKAGLIEGIAAGGYVGMLTLYDNASDENGLAWQSVGVLVRDWPVCDS